MKSKYIKNNIKLLYKGHKIKKINKQISVSDEECILIIRYVNENNIEIFPMETQVFKKGDNYDVSSRLNVIIDGFEFKEVQGNVKGNIQNDTEIVLVFKAIENEEVSAFSYKIPHISYGYWNPKPYDTEEVVIPLYITDFYQKEYLQDDTSLRFKLRVEVDGEVTWLENLPAGDYDLNLGVLEKGNALFYCSSSG